MTIPHQSKEKLGYMSYTRSKVSQLRPSIASVLVADVRSRKIQCGSKKQMSFNKALDVASYIWEETGDFLSVSISACTVSRIMSGIIEVVAKGLKRPVSGVDNPYALADGVSMNTSVDLGRL